jgi:hypothetical protein
MVPTTRSAEASVNLIPILCGSVCGYASFSSVRSSWRDPAGVASFLIAAATSDFAADACQVLVAA